MFRRGTEIIVETTRHSGSAVMSCAFFRAMNAALERTDFGAAHAALPDLLELLPLPFVPRGPVVPSLTTKQVEDLLVPVTKLLLHQYSDVQLEGISCAVSLTEQPANVLYMLNHPPTLAAIIQVFKRPMMKKTAVLAAQTLSQLCSGPDCSPDATRKVAAAFDDAALLTLVAASCACDTIEQQIARSFALDVLAQCIDFTDVRVPISSFVLLPQQPYSTAALRDHTVSRLIALLSTPLPADLFTTPLQAAPRYLVSTHFVTSLSFETIAQRIAAVLQANDNLHWVRNGLEVRACIIATVWQL